MSPEPDDTHAPVAPGPGGAPHRFRVRAALGLLLLGACVLASVEAWSAVAYLTALHGALGRGLPAALGAVWVLLLLPPVSFGAWALRPFWAREPCPGVWRHPGLSGGGIAAALLLAGSVAWSYAGARLTPTAAAEQALAESELERALSELRGLSSALPAEAAPVPPLVGDAPVRCPAPPSVPGLTLFTRFARRGSGGAIVDACLQGQSLAGVISELSVLLREHARRGPVLIDWVSGRQTLSGRHAWMDALKLRPGLDGVCDGPRCLTPGQLLSEGFFSTFRPVDFIPDFQFGVDPLRLRAAVGAAPHPGLSGLTRVSTRSYVLDLGSAGTLTPLVRLRRRDVPVTRSSVQRGLLAAQSHILSAQQADGRFRYTLHPLSGEADTRSFNLARQAGTTLVLCELGRDGPAVRSAIERSLRAFSDFERRRGSLTALTGDPSAPVARLGESALPLVSFLACAPRLGSGLPEVAAGLARLLLALQRPDGGFWPALDLPTGEPLPGPEPLYATGQAVLALVLLEAHQQRHADPRVPPVGTVRAAVERSMDYFASRYWAHPLRDFFFLEENWHCLAARAALPLHRHAGYEDFCWRYVRFKARLILEREQGVDADFDGGFGFGNLVPPHNTGAAGFGEALAAALQLRRAQGLPAPAEERLLLRVLGFLLRQQWSPENCFACATPLVIGGLSEHTHSLLTRIDFAQHAWAALGHGAAVLSAALPER